MPDRTIVINGNSWRVEPSGRVTSSDRDEIGLLFVRGSGDGREVRVTRTSRASPEPRTNTRPISSRSKEVTRPLVSTRQVLPLMTIVRSGMNQSSTSL